MLKMLFLSTLRLFYGDVYNLKFFMNGEFIEMEQVTNWIVANKIVMKAKIVQVLPVFCVGVEAFMQTG